MSSVQKLPKILQYSSIKPQGFPSKYQQWEVFPMANQQTYTVNDLIRFQFQTDKFIDPYGVYFEIKVEVPQTSENMPCVALQRKTKFLIPSAVVGSTASASIFCDPLADKYLWIGINNDSLWTKGNAAILPDYSNVCAYFLDGSAGSIISESILYSNGREVERQQEYDQLSNILLDFGVCKTTRQKQVYQGLKQYNIQNNQQSRLNFSSLAQPFFNQNKTKNSFNTSGPNYYSCVNASDNNQEKTSTLNDTRIAYSLMQMINNSQISPAAILNTNDILSTANVMWLSKSTSQQSLTQINSYINQGIEALYINQNVGSTQNIAASVGVTIPTSGSLVQAIGTVALSQSFNASENSNEVSGVYSQYSCDYQLQSSYIQNSFQNYYTYPYNKINNLVRNMCLNDSSQSVEHFDTISGHMFYVYGDQKPINFATSSVGNTYGGVIYKQLPYTYLSNLTNYNLIQYNGQDQYPISNEVKQQKRLLNNDASQLNICDYICPGIPNQRWVNGKPVTNYKFGVPTTSIQNYTSIFTNTYLISNLGSPDTQMGAQSINYVQVQLDNQASEYYFATTKKTYYIPFLSGVLGHLIPQEQWKLIPGNGCGVLNLELRLNRFAFWMSGHKANSTITQIDPTNQYQFHNGKTSDGWQIKKISLHLDLWDFGTEVKSLIDQQLQGDGITLSSHCFQMGPQYTISQTSQLKGTWQINNNVKSCRHLYFWFLDDRYQKYNFLRKQFRLSHNMKSYYLKCGSNYYPEQPTFGHAGNLNEPIGSTQGTFATFYMDLLRSHEGMFSTESKMNILPSAYVVNDRAFNPSDNSQGMMQSSMIHEQRLNGKAIYCLDFQADPYDLSVFSGLDIGTLKPVELVLDVHQGSDGGDFTNQSTMYMFLHCDMIVQFSKDGIQTFI